MVDVRRIGSGPLIDLRDRNGQGLTFAYNQPGELVGISDSVGRDVALEYDGSGGLVRLLLPDGRSVRYTYASGRLAAATDVRGGTITYSYDAGGRLSEVVDQNGHSVVRNTYGADGRVVEQLDARGSRSVFSWDGETETATMLDARGGMWRDIYSNGILVAQIDPLGNTISYGYDVDLNQTSRMDARGNTWTFVYDARGNMIRRTAPDPLGYQEDFTFNARNDVASYTDGRRRVTAFDYDANGNLIRMIRPGSVVTTFSRNPSGTGQLVGIQNPLGRQTSFWYDSYGNLVRIGWPAGASTTMTYDTAGRVASVVEPRGNEVGADPDQYRWTFQYDAAGYLLRRSDPLGHETIYAYDGVGNRTSVTNAKGGASVFEFDAANHLVKAGSPLPGAETNYRYDAGGNLIERIDAAGRSAGFSYDAAGRLTEATTPLGTTSFEHDPNGNYVRKTTPAGNATIGDPADGSVTYAYDSINRLIGITYSDSTPPVQFSYDANSNRTAMTDGAGTETYTYDDLDRVTRIARGAIAWIYEYDAVGNVMRRGGTAGDVRYTYDEAGRMSSAGTGSGAVSYQYDAAGNLVRTNLPASNGFMENRAYDRAGRLVSLRTTSGDRTLSAFEYSLDELGNPFAVTDALGGTTTFKYDELQRVTEVCYVRACTLPADKFIRWTYDRVGNRTSETRSIGTTNFAYNDADQLTSRSGPTGDVTYSHDLNGNMTSAGDKTFSYDLDNRLVRAGDSTSTIRYRYDGDGNRVESETTPEGSSPTISRHLWDRVNVVPQLAADTNANGQVARTYDYGLQRISMSVAGERHFYHHDALGSVVNVTSSTGMLEASYSYEPFGAARKVTVTSPLAPANPMRFAGESLDATGLYNLRARAMDPSLGRFLQVDPVASPVGTPYVSAYVYANNRPTVLIDPLGLFPWRTVFKGIAVVASVVAVVASAGLLAPPTAAIVLSISTVAGVGASVVGTMLDCADEDASSESCADSMVQSGVGLVLAGVGVKSVSNATQLAAALADVAMHVLGPTK
ncbi:MAG: RHS repeat-associated core domain-containing protein [Actinomycetota bacterium]